MVMEKTNEHLNSVKAEKGQIHRMGNRNGKISQKDTDKKLCLLRLHSQRLQAASRSLEKSASHSKQKGEDACLINKTCPQKSMNKN